VATAKLVAISITPNEIDIVNRFKRR